MYVLSRLTALSTPTAIRDRTSEFHVPMLYFRKNDTRSVIVGYNKDVDSYTCERSPLRKQLNTKKYTKQNKRSDKPGTVQEEKKEASKTKNEINNK